MTEHQHSGFGETLRRRREQLGLSLNDVAVRTRIRKSYLQALEEENLSALPGAAYVIGFLRIYARQLDLAVDPLLAALPGRAEAGNDRKLQPGSDGSHSGARGKAGRSGLWRVLLLLIVVGLGIGGYLFFKSGQTVAPAPAEPPAPPIVATPQPTPSPVQPQAAEPATTAPAPDVASLSVLPPEGAIVRMLAVGAGVMKVTLDGQDSRDYQLQTGQQLNWKVSSQLQLEFSAPGLIRCWVGEQEIPLAEQAAVRLVASPPGQGERP